MFKIYTKRFAILILTTSCIILAFRRNLFDYRIDRSERIGQTVEVHVKTVPLQGESGFWERHFIRKAKKNVESHGYLIVAISNDGAHLMTLNFVKSLEIQGYQQFLIACLDEQLFERLYNLNYSSHISIVPQSWLQTKITAEMVNWETPKYIDITQAKTHVVYRLLQLNFTVFLNDVDLVWLSPNISNHLSQISQNGPELIAMDDGPMINSGFYVAKPTVIIQNLFSLMIEIQKNETTWNDQYALRAALSIVKFDVSKVIYKLDMREYANGLSFFLENRPSKKGVKPLVVHANYMVGKEKKIRSLQKAGFWFLPKRTKS